MSWISLVCYLRESDVSGVLCRSNTNFLFSVLQKDEVYLNLVLEFIPETVYKVARHYNKSKQTIPISFNKVSNI